MSEKYKANTDLPYFTTLTLQGWIDLFTRHRYADLVIDSLRFCHENKGLIIHEYVIMSNHVHLIIQHDDAKLPGILRDLKSHLAKTIIEKLKSDRLESRREWMLKLFAYYAKYLKQNRHYVVWRKTNKPIILHSNERYENCKNYILQNPVKAQLVSEAYHWKYSSAHEEAHLKDILRKRNGQD